MKKPGSLDVVGQVAYGKAMRSSWRGAALAIALSFSVVLAEWHWNHGAGQTVQLTSPSTTGAVITIDGVGGVTWTKPSRRIDEPFATFAPVTDADTMAAFHAAVKAWAAEFGGKLPIPYPRLMKAEDPDIGYCRGMVAYAEPALNRVVVCQFYDHKVKTVMLHEVGHLLGVPHIEGDDLMHESAGVKELEKPSPFAVAIAKAVKR